MHNVQLRVLCAPQRRVMAAPDPIVLTLVDVYRASLCTTCTALVDVYRASLCTACTALVDAYRTSPFLARDATACQVIEPKIASLKYATSEMRRQAIVASAVASRARFHATRVGLEAGRRTTMVRWMGSLRDKGRPVTDAMERFHAVSSPRPSMGGLRWYWRCRA